jgi:outer membrane receptor protein involved in Fe transport
MSAKVRTQVAMLAALLHIGAAAALAQSDAGGLRVLVIDSSGGVVPGADVTVTNVATNAAETRISNSEGYALFTPIQRGVYIVDVALSGFQPVRIRDVSVEVQQDRLVRATMAVSQVSETLEVRAAAAPVQSEEGSLGQVIRGEVAVELPLAARRYSDLALLTPGATNSTLNTEIRGPGWFTVNGTSHSQNNFLLDGFDNNQGTTNMQSLSAQVVQPSPDAIGEFKVQTNAFSAEFGRSAGAVVNVSLKSGTNSTRGSAWYYNRDDSLAATSWRANLLNQRKDDLSWNQFGGTLGGPVVRNKLFYFGHYEGFKSDRSNLFLTQVPTASQRSGQFPFTVRDPVTGQPFPNNQIPQDRFDPLGLKFVNLYPAPNLPGRVVAGGRTVENFGISRPQTEDTHKFDVRTDYYVSQKDRVFVRYSFLQQDIFRGAIFEPPADDGAQGRGTQYSRNQSLGASWTRILGGTAVNEFRVGYNRTYATFSHETAGGLTGTEFGFQGIPPELDAVGGLPRIAVSNYEAMGTGSWRPQYQLPQSYQFLNVLTVAKGQHALSAGAEFRHKNNEFVDVQRRNPEYTFTGFYTGDGVGDLLLGWPQTLRMNNLMTAVQLQQAYAAFVQDDWKLTPNFTLNLGLRYEYTTPYWAKEPFPHINLDFDTGELIRATSDDRYLVDTDKNNLAPRLGFAYQAVPEKVVVRGGFGVFYGGEEFRGSGGNLVMNPPNMLSPLVQAVGNARPPYLLSDPVPGFLVQEWNPADSVRTGLQTRDPDQDVVTYYQWNVAVEYALPLDSTIELAYVANRGRNLPGTWQANQVPFGLDGTVPANRPYPMWNTIEKYDTRARSQYDGFQARYQRRYAKGWYNLTSYTYGRAFSETGGFAAGNAPQIGGDWRSEWAPDSQTPRHRLSVANIYQLPIGRDRAIGSDWSGVTDFFLGGWQISALITWQTGIPVNVSLAANGVNPATGQSYRFLSRNGGTLRPDLVGSPNTDIDPKEDRFNFLDSGAYRVQALNTPGNAPRNSAWGPGYANLDVSLVKRFRVDDTRYFDFRFEAFNVTNSTRFRNPDGNYGGSNFGIINDAYDPRVVQVALRFAF